MESARGARKESIEDFGLQVVSGDVEVGGTYPLFGMITKFLDHRPGQLKVEINFGITANIVVDDAARVEVLRERIFESGIFVSTVVAKDPAIEVDCQTIIFGRKQNFNA